MKELKQGMFNIEFSLINVDYKISLSSAKSENDGISSQRYKAELRAGPKIVVLEKILLDGETVYDIHGEGPGMDDEAERNSFLKNWVLVVIGQLQRHAREMNETDQDDQLKQSLTSFLKLYKHFFEPRLLSLLEENQGSFGNDTDSAETDGNTLTSNSGTEVRDGDEDSSTSMEVHSGSSDDEENDSNNGTGIKKPRFDKS